MFRHRIRGSQYWLNDQPIELDSPIVQVTIYRNQLADLGLPPFDHGGRPTIPAIVYVRDGTVYDIGSTGAVLRTFRRSSPFPLQAGLDADVAITVEGRTLTVGEEIVPMSSHIKEVGLVQDVIVVTREPAGSEDVRNVLAVDTTGRLAWVIDAPAPFERALVPICYLGVAFRDGRLTAKDDFGRIFALDLTNGCIGEQLGREMDR